MYFKEWDEFLEDTGAFDVGCVLEALIDYCHTGELTEFEDKSLKQFYRRQIRLIEADRVKYEQKCSRSAYNRYCGKVRQQGGVPLEYDEWLEDPEGALNINNNTNKNKNINKNINTNNSKRRWASNSVPEKSDEERREEFMKTLEELRSS